MIRRKTIGPPLSKVKVPYPTIDNKPGKVWDNGYEIVVSFAYGLDEEAIAKVLGLRNYDTGYDFDSGRRDLMFPCGSDKRMAHTCAKRLWKSDHFGALTIKISYPVEQEGKNTFTSWYSWNGKLIERVKHRKMNRVIKRHGQRRRKTDRTRADSTALVVQTMKTAPATAAAEPSPKPRT